MSRGLINKVINYLINNIHKQSVRVWSGVLWPTANQDSITWTDDGKWKSITLIFSGYANSAAQDYQFITYTVPREFIRLHEGKGHTIHLSGANWNPVGCKYVYFFLDHLAGADYNDDTGTSAAGITYHNENYVIREVYLNY